MGATLGQIAKRVGLSVPAVSYALSDDPAKRRQVSRDTVARVMRVARSMGYRRNASATATATGRTNAIALLQSVVGRRSNLPPEMLRGIHDALEPLGMHLILSRLSDERLVDDAVVPKILTHVMADGLLVDYNDEVPQAMLELIRRHRIPAVWLNFKQDMDCVRPDDFGAGEMVTRRLIEAGHRRITYLQLLPLSHYSGADRRSGYESAMRKAGLPIRMIVSPEYMPMGERVNMLATMLRDADRSTAFVAYGEEAHSAVLAAMKVGLSLPRDLSVITFAGEAGRRDAAQLAFAVIPEHACGKVGVEMLLRRIEKRRAAPVPTITLPFDFHAGATFGPAPAGSSRKSR